MLLSSVHIYCFEMPCVAKHAIDVARLSFSYAGKSIAIFNLSHQKNRHQNFFLLRYSALEYAVYAHSCKNVLYIPL